jgi:hypothetical protein
VQEQVSAAKNEYHHPLWELAKAQYVPWDDSLLERDDLTIHQIGAILEVNEIHQMYDYDRVLDLNCRNMRSAGEYIRNGGICRDAANATAELLTNNGHQAKIVMSKSRSSSPHAFVVASDDGGSFYIFDYEWLYEVSHAGSFWEAATSYSPYLTLMLLDPETHRVTDLVRSADADHLDTIAGMGDRSLP